MTKFITAQPDQYAIIPVISSFKERLMLDLSRGDVVLHFKCGYKCHYMLEDQNGRWKTEPSISSVILFKDYKSQKTQQLALHHEKLEQ